MEESLSAAQIKRALDHPLKILIISWKLRFLNLLIYSSMYIPYESPILDQLLDIISLGKINLFESRFKTYNPWDMAK
jgi:hypothetical protein